MKISLVYPGIVRIGFKSIGKGGMNCNWINLGLAYIGAYLKLYSYDVDLIDLREYDGFKQLEEEMRYRNADIFGIHFNTPNYNNALKCCKIAKKLKKIVVAGGPHASIAPNELISTGYVDYVITGEGELSFLELLEKLSRSSQVERIIAGKPVENLDQLPFPDRDLYNIKKIINPIGNFPFMDNGIVLLTSRGCPYNCSFCQPLANQMFGRRIRYRSVENVINELKYIVSKYKVKYVSFQDDTFTVRKKWVLELCRRIREEKLAIQWSAQSRVDTLDEELVEVMKNSGCVCLFFGFESGSQRILNFLRKGISPQQSIKAADLCKKYGILIFADYMLGIPTETKKDL
ncbi:MAG: radical SAM protein, partial [Elusimicrobiota bacterium]|nr:radical SAM protein [Elusimicrobiota bacterium]